MKITFFRTASQMRSWLEKHAESSTELWVGFYKKDSGKPSLTWPESVGEALCFGWIDGVRKSIDDTSYMIRFSPRKAMSIWSEVNIKIAQSLIEQERMQPVGLKAFQARRSNKSGIYSYEQRSESLPEAYERVFKRNKSAWDYFQAQAPSYRKAACWWIVSAKQEKTRLSRLGKLIDDSGTGRRLQLLTSKKS